MEPRADFLIIGSGIAGLRAAVELAGAGEVLILTKAHTREGSTGYAQGGIAAAIGPDDTAALHARDTIACGDGLCNERAVEVLVHEGPHYVRELMAWGAAFDRGPDGEPALAIEAAHSARRVLHARDATGREIARVLWERVARLPNVRTLEHARVLGLILDSDGACAGARFLLEDGTEGTVSASVVLVATGGAGQVYSDTTNPAVATGDGIAMACRAGARVIDMEFVQFHPTALRVDGHPRFLLSEALRGEGAWIINDAGERFMERYEAAAELAPRDRVARAIVREMRDTGGPVYLSLAHLPPDFVHARFPLVSAACRSAGFDLARDRIPIGPAAHYLMGGIETDLDGATSLPGLFAAGEAACTGVHGANRLASNSLLEGLVFGARAGRAMVRARRKTAAHSGATVQARAGRFDSPSSARDAIASVQALMWQHVGLFREETGLGTALESLDSLWMQLEPGSESLDASTADAVSLVTIGRLIARAARRRTESRGAHFRTDYPARDDVHWKRRVGDVLE